MLKRIRLTCSLLRMAAGVLAISASVSISAAEEPIVASDAVLEKLFEGNVLTEGVSTAPDGMVYFSEITFSHKSRDAKGAIDAGFIWKFDPASKTTTIFRSPTFHASRSRTAGMPGRFRTIRETFSALRRF